MSVHAFLFLLAIVAMAPAQDEAPAQATESARNRQPGVNAVRLYNGINRPVIIEVNSPRSFGQVKLALMDDSGELLSEPALVHPGRIDLAETMPGIWQLERAAYLQMIDMDQSIGPALVLQPMLSRMVPVTEVQAHVMTGQPHTRIMDWKDENAFPPPVMTPGGQPGKNGAAASPGDAQNDAKRPTDGEPKVDQNATQPPSTPAAPPPPAPPAAPPSSATVKPLMSGLRIYLEHDVILRTTKGDIHVAMKPDEAPNTVWNFLELARGGFYRDIAFHRVVKFDRHGRPFVIQAGDPTGTGDGGPGYWLPIENSKLPHDFGVISMARADDPDSAGSQFFIALSREGTSRLDGQYCAFGYAVSGAEAIVAIAESELADVQAGRPVDPPRILDAELSPSPPRSPGRGRSDARITPESVAPPRPAQPTRVPR